MSSPAEFEVLLNLLEHAQRARDLDALDNAIAGLNRLNEQPPEADPYRARVLANLGEALRQRYEMRSDRADLVAAIEVAQQALRLISPADPRRPVMLRSLSILLQTRVEKYGGADAAAQLRRAEELARAAVDETDPADSRRPMRLHALASAQRLRYEFGGAPHYLADAISTARQAHAAAPDEAYLVSHLGLTLRMRYERTGSRRDLDEAITVGRAAAGCNDPTHAPMIWSNLSTMLEARYIHLGDSADLDDAVAVAHRAVEQTEPAYSYHAMFLAVLARILQVRGAQVDLAEAIAAAERAIDATAATVPVHAERTALLARILLDRGTPADVDRAADLSRSAAQASQRSARPNPEVLHTAAVALARRTDRAEALRYATKALRATVADDPLRASIEVSLGDLAADPPTAARHYRAAAGQRSAAPSLRCAAAHRWATVAQAAGDLAEATRAYRHAVELLPQATSRALSRADRERQLERRVGLAADAAATALSQAQPALAVRLLEQGRSVLHSQFLDVRADFAVLRQRHPELGARVAGLAALLDRPP